jgi:hypothetical protein
VKVDRALPASELAEANRRLVNIPAKAQIQVKRVLQKGRIVRESFTLRRFKSEVQQCSIDDMAE